MSSTTSPHPRTDSGYFTYEHLTLQADTNNDSIYENRPDVVSVRPPVLSTSSRGESSSSGSTKGGSTSSTSSGQERPNSIYMPMGAMKQSEPLCGEESCQDGSLKCGERAPNYEYIDVHFSPAASPVPPPDLPTRNKSVKPCPVHSGSGHHVNPAYLSNTAHPTPRAATPIVQTIASSPAIPASTSSTKTDNTELPGYPSDISYDYSVPNKQPAAPSITNLAAPSPTLTSKCAHQSTASKPTAQSVVRLGEGLRTYQDKIRKQRDGLAKYSSTYSSMNTTV